MSKDPLYLIEHEDGTTELLPAERLPPGYKPAASTIGSDGKPIDPRTLIDVCALVQRLQDYVNGVDGAQMFDGQLAAARMLLDRVLPATQSIKFSGEVRHRIVPDDITPEQAQRDYLEMVRGTKALN